MRIADCGLRIDCGGIAPTSVALLATIVLVGSPRSAPAETIDRVLAVAAGQVIMLTDVTAARDFGLQRDDGAPDPTRAILAKLIDRALMLAEVDRYGPPEPETEAIDRALADVRARFGDRQAFAAALARSGIDEQHLRETLRQDLRLRTYLDQRFSSTDPRRQTLLDEWLASLRRRGDVIDLYSQG
jgi:hypothetical protein